MEIKGKIINHLPITTGEGAKGQWQKGGFVVEVEKGKFTKTIMFSTWGETVDAVRVMPTGMNVSVEFDLESREYNGKYYTDAKAWKVQGVDSSPVAKKTYSTSNDPSDLPF